MTRDQLTERIDTMLEEAEAFERGGAPLEALARARHAADVLSRHARSIEAALAGELVARVEDALRRHEEHVARWQSENESRHGAFLARESAAIAHGPSWR